MTKENVSGFFGHPPEEHYSRHKRSARLQPYFEEIDKEAVKDDSTEDIIDTQGGSIAFADEPETRPSYLDIDRQLHEREVADMCAAQYVSTYHCKPEFSLEILSAKLTKEMREVLPAIGIDVSHDFFERKNELVGFVVDNFHAIVGGVLPRPGKASDAYSWYCRAVRTVESISQYPPEHIDGVWGELVSLICMAADRAPDEEQAAFARLYDKLEHLMYATAKLCREPYLLEITEQRLKQRLEAGVSEGLETHARESELFIPQHAHIFLAQSILGFTDQIGLYDFENQLSELGSIITEDGEEQSGIDAEWNYICALQCMKEALGTKNKKSVSRLFSRIRMRLNNCRVLHDEEKTEIGTTLKMQRRLGRVYLGKQKWHPRTTIPEIEHTEPFALKPNKEDLRRDYGRRRT